jgi:hypothetical protein
LRLPAYTVLGPLMFGWSLELMNDAGRSTITKQYYDLWPR